MIGMLALSWMLACDGETDLVDPWLVEDIDLGDPLASGTGYVFDTPQSAWFAAEHVVPDLTWVWPASNLPLYLWTEVLMGENVSDQGTCPYVTASGGSQVWKSGCRSQDGYDWDGTFTEDEDYEDGWTTYSYLFALEVASEVDNRAFDRIALSGEVVYTDGDDEALVRASQANLTLEASGYWSRGFEDELEAAWSGLVLTGRWEGTMVDGTEVVLIDARVDLGELGGFHVTGSVSGDGCLVEPAGEIVLAGAQQARLVFEGQERCDGCAEYYLDGERQANVCRVL